MNVEDADSELFKAKDKRFLNKAKIVTESQAEGFRKATGQVNSLLGR